MHKEIAERWVEALRSGAYPQTTGYLCDDDGFCCLGVLTDIYDKDKFDHSQWRNTNDCDHDCMIYCGEIGVLPEEVQRWADMRGSQGNVNGSSLVIMNDEGLSFETIADFIEANYKEL